MKLLDATVMYGPLETMKRGLYEKLTRHKVCMSLIDYICIEVTTRCNISCGFCLHKELMEKGIRHQKDMSRMEFNRVLEVLKEYRSIPSALNEYKTDAGLILSPCGLGETLLHKDIKGMVDDMRRVFPDAVIDITTNGWYLDDWLLDSEVDVLHISLNHVHPIRYKAFTGKDQGGLVRSIQDFMKKRDGGGPRMFIQLLDVAGLRESVLFYTSFSSLLQKGDVLRRVKDELVWADGFRSGYVCGGMSLCLDVDGNVFPCCVGRCLPPKISHLYPDGRVCLGNIHDGVKALNDAYLNLIQRQITGLNDVCGFCPQYKEKKK